MIIKVLLLGVMFIVGCGSSSSTLSATSKTECDNVSTCIKKFDETFELPYLKKANQLSTTRDDTLNVEKRLVDYLGASKVFDVSIADTLGSLKANSSKALLGSGKSVKKNVRLKVVIKPKKNLPFKLQYGDYTVEVVISENTSYYVKQIFQKPRMSQSQKKISSKSVFLNSRNNWRAEYTINTNVLTHSDTSDIVRGKVVSELRKLEYDAKIYLIK